MKEKVVFEFYDFINPEVNVSREDGGCALSASVTYDKDGLEHDKGVFVSIQSWDEDSNHFDFKKLLNRRVRVIIETID